MTKSPPGTRFVLGAAAFVLTAALALFLWRWELYYNSDYALVSLICKRIADGRDFPLFIYKVGYEGMIFDGLGTAAVFRLFGMTPYTMNVFEVICTIALFVAFYFTVRKTDGPRTASWATLFLAFSCPFFYGKVAHPSPNYAQTLLLGTLWTWLYLDLWKAAKPWKAVALGFVGGFGYYTYQTVAFFFAATAAHGFLAGLNARPIPAREDAWKEWLAPRRRLKSRVALALAKVATPIAGLGLALSILGYAGIQKLQWGELTLAAWDPTQTLLVAIALWAAQHAANFVSWHRYIALGAAGFFVGISPKFYYNWILKLPSAAKTSPGGTLEALAKRTRFAIVENLRFLNLTELSVLHGALFVGALGLMIWGLKPTFQRALKLLRGKGTSKDVLGFSPFVFLAFAGIVAFATSQSVYEASNSRYMISNWLAFAMMLAAGWTALPLGKKGVRIAAVLGLTAFWGNTLWTYRTEYLATQVPHPHLALRDWLEKEGLREGYADYWIAYSLNFLSNERLSFEPIYSNYIPDYGPRIGALKKVAYVDFDPPHAAPDSDGTVYIEYRPYRVLRRERVGEYWVQVLERR